ncbi:MAG: ATP-dependent DNA helicase PcrA [candidate division TM6 bacterium GW2011_GWF2_32_72]|nr:MAG: ATP-dependent DNA helicase PcrA [candidate division TM6 bacterium GW2011_GWF2_32_72]
MEDFKKHLENNLNAQQLKAVKPKNGIFQVIAGAGSGKTRVITSRIANLITTHNVSPSAILALTFTNKAAKEMQERIINFLDAGSAMPFIGTFHSYCLQILKTNKAIFNNQDFTILDQDDQQKLIASIIKRKNLTKQVTPKNIAYQISTIKNTVLNVSSDGSYFKKDPLLHQIYIKYEEEKLKSNCLDFDDLMLEALHLFKKSKRFKDQFHERVQHILVDEYQDTNVVQHALLKQMCKNSDQIMVDSLCIVGDEDQSIYSWRGATVDNIMQIKKDFPETHQIKIEQNYRSVQPILEAANHVIANNKNRNPKKLWSEKQARNRIKGLCCTSNYQEGDIIASFLKVYSKEKPLKDCAVLYRTHFQSRTIEEALIKNSIPYKIVGGVQFYERKEIKDLLAYMRLVANPFDRVSFFRVINTPSRKLGEQFEEVFYDHWNLNPFLKFDELSNKLIEDKVITKSKAESLLAFTKCFENLTGSDKPNLCLARILERTQYIPYIKANHEIEEAEERIGNIKELARAIDFFEGQKIDTVSKFLDEVALIQDKLSDKNEAKDFVQLMTLHAAKGLEFENVIMTGLEEGIFPSTRSIYEDNKLEEERRLFYVGMTRAKERLLLSHSKHRYAYGQMEEQTSSRFFDEVPQDLIQIEDCAYMGEHHFARLFSDWIGLKGSFGPGSIITFGESSKPNLKPSTIVNKYKEFAHKLGTGTVKQPQPVQSVSSVWKKSRAVTHPKFGVGLIDDVEKKDDGNFKVTVKFKSGIKKLDSSFLKLL